MRFQWQQFSPKEKEALVRHFVLDRAPHSPITAEKICEALNSTHSLACSTAKKGVSVYRFIASVPGGRSGSASSNNRAEGVFKAALRALGVDLDDDAEETIASSKSTRRRIVRPVHALK